MFIETDRLILRAWKDEDALPYLTINQDRKVTEFLPGSLTVDQVNDFISRMAIHQEKFGYSLLAAEEKKSGELLGFIGLNYTDFPAPFKPAVEVGWRLGSQYWGKGYATEGAKAILNYGFTKCGLGEIVSFTVPTNLKSIGVMERIGLKRETRYDFVHPKLPLDHRLSNHIVYKLTLDEYITRV